MIKKPFFSIAIPTYNRANDLQFALFCILRQTFLDYEIVISDNCSTDHTKTVIDKLHNKKIRYYKTRRNIEIDQNQKNAVIHSKGEYILIHADDDFLLYSNALMEIYQKIIKSKLGYYRINYVCLALDRKHIFAFKIKKTFTQNSHLEPNLDNSKVLSFILNTHHHFITGIVIKNSIPRHIQVVNTDPSPFINYIFYAAKKYGACFISKPYLVAYWSRRIIKKNEEHHLFNIKNGKLKSENYFKAVKKKLNIMEYNSFLHNELMNIYVLLFPAIKMNVGNKILLDIAARVRILDETMVKSITYWIYLSIALIFPRMFLKIFRDLFLSVYIRTSKVKNEREVINNLLMLEKEYIQLNRMQGSIFKIT